MARLQKGLSELESAVMKAVWAHAPCRAEQVRKALGRRRQLADSTVRTILRRLEEKGYVRHRTEGRTNLYEYIVPPEKAAARAIRRIVDRLCHGSVETLLLGMVSDKLISKAELAAIAAKVDEPEEPEP